MYISWFLHVTVVIGKYKYQQSSDLLPKEEIKPGMETTSKLKIFNIYFALLSPVEFIF